MSQNSSGLLDTQMLAGLTDAKVAIVYTEWNDKIVGALVEGCERVGHLFRIHATYIDGVRVTQTRPYEVIHFGELGVGA